MTMTATEWLGGLLTCYRASAKTRPSRQNIDLVAAIERHYDTLLGQVEVLFAIGYTAEELVLLRHPDEKVTEVLPRSFIRI